jgi:hypothetical protein
VPLPENESNPGRCRPPEPAHPPGATRKVERSTTDRSTGVNLRHDQTHRPSSSRGSSAGDAAFRPVGRSPGPAAFGSSPTGHPAATRRPDHVGRLPDLRHRSQDPVPGCPVRRPSAPHRLPGTVPPRPPRSVARPPSPESPETSIGRPTSVAGVGARSPVARSRCPSTPFTLTRSPVPSLDAAGPPSPG